MSFKSWIDDAAEFLVDGIRSFANSGVAGSAVGKTARFGLNVGKKVGSAGIHVGAIGLSKIFDGVSWMIDNKETIGRTAKNIGSGVAGEGGTILKSGLNLIEKIADSGKIIKRADVDRSLFGWEFTKGAKAAIVGGAFLTGSIGAGKDYLTDRTGRNDGRTYSPTPNQTNPYDIASGMAYGPSIGQSFANNAGATGDLVFALDNMRR